MSECRGLPFHVQEHQFTIPRVADLLKEAGSTFLGFRDTGAATFAQMYQFWIQKN
jgi:hypothetical protein